MSEAVYQRVIEARLGAPDSVTGGDTNYPCCFCAKLGHSSHLHVHFGKGMALCHRCGYGTRTLENLIRDLYGHLPKNILRLLDRAAFAQSVEEILAEKKHDEERFEPTPLPKSFQRLPCRGIRVAREIRAYIHKRGYDDDAIDRFGLGFVTKQEHPAYGHVVFPYYMGGQAVYWQGRKAVERSGPKNYNPKGGGKREILYGYDQAATRKRAMIVEGPFDAIAADMNGYGGIGLTLNSLNQIQARLIAAIGFESHVVCLDGPKDDAEDTWDQRVKDPLNQRKLPRPLVYARMIARASGAKTGYLRLDEGDPDENRDRLRKLCRRETVWLADDVVGAVDAILKNKSTLVV